MPVTRSRNGLYDFNLDQTNTTRFLFGEDEETHEIKQYQQAVNMDDTFPTLTRREGQPNMVSRPKPQVLGWGHQKVKSFAISFQLHCSSPSFTLHPLIYRLPYFFLHVPPKIYIWSKKSVAKKSFISLFSRFRSHSQTFTPPSHLHPLLYHQTSDCCLIVRQLQCRTGS